MAKKDKKDSSSKFSESNDSRCTVTFQNSNNDIRNSNSSLERSATQKEITDRNQDFLSKQLFDYLESRIKIVDVPEENLDLQHFEIKEVPMFFESPILNEDTIMEKIEITSSQPKKKRKKEKKSEKERFKEVAVTADWLEKQAKLFNS